VPVYWIDKNFQHLLWLFWWCWNFFWWCWDFFWLYGIFLLVTLEFFWLGLVLGGAGFRLVVLELLLVDFLILTLRLLCMMFGGCMLIYYRDEIPLLRATI